MESGDGVLAWEALRRVDDYEDAWRRHGADGSPHALEPGPFRIRIQTQADLEAGRFELLAWEDPRKADGPASPFWRQDGMLEGMLGSGAEPLAAMVGDGGSVEGLRLLGGDCGMRSRIAQPGSESLLSRRLVGGSECGNGTSNLAQATGVDSQFLPGHVRFIRRLCISVLPITLAGSRK